MRDRRLPNVHTGLLLAALVLLSGLAGCLGMGDSGETAPADATEPSAEPRTNGTEERGADQEPSEDSPSSSGPVNATGEANASTAGRALPTDLVWATDDALVHWDGDEGNTSRVTVRDAAGAEVTAIAEGPEGSLYASTMPNGEGSGGGVDSGPAPALVRVDLSSGDVETVHEGEPLSNPLALTVLEDGRILLADRGELGWPPQGAPSPSGRLVEVSPDGSATVLTTDSRFQGWMDVRQVGDQVYLATQTDQRFLSPTNASGEGEGAIWTVDPDQGTHELVSASSTFRSPSGIASGPEGSLYLTEWDGARLLEVDRSSGDASVLDPVDGSENLWGLDTLPDGRIVAADAGGIWLVDPAADSAERLVEDDTGSPRHVRALGAR